MAYSKNIWKIKQPKPDNGNVLLKVATEMAGRSPDAERMNPGRIVNMNQHRSNANWPRLLTPHRGWLSAVIYARVRDYDAVEEVLQETAVAAMVGNRPTDQADVSRWLYRVALRQALLYRRNRGRNRKKQNGYADVALQREAAGQPATNPLSIVIATERAELVRKALDRLTSADCEILLLKYTENWSCTEMATRLGVSTSAVKSRLLRARGNLRKELVRLNESWEE